MITFLWNFAELKEKANLTVWSAIRTIFYSINSFIYKLIIDLYDVFEALCNGKLLDSNTLNALFGRIGVILGLIMFMYVAFSFIKIIIDPDSFNDKQKGMPNLIKKVIIVIVMLGVSSYVFTILSNIQSAIINNHVISKFIMPTGVETDAFGNLLSSQLFLSFYTFKDNVNADEDDDVSRWCKEYAVVKLQESIVSNKNFDIGLDCLNAYGDVENYVGDGEGQDFLIEYNFVFCFIVGVVVCYLLLTYCISVGIRMIQLAVLQIISPMAIVSYLSPKQDTMFSKWTKIYVSTYIDVFIRIAIINFMVYLSGFVLDSWTNRDNFFWKSVGGNAGSKSYVIGILMILALLSFAKKAPELIKDLFPQAASKLGFGLGNEGASAFIGAGVGATVGAIGGVAGGKGASRITGLLGGIGTGALRGGKSGFGAKGLGSAISGSASAQAKANIARAQRIGSGQGFFSYYGDRAQNLLGMTNSYERLSSEVSSYDDIKAEVKKSDAMEDFNRTYNSEYTAWLQQNPGGNESDFIQDYASARNITLSSYDFDTLEKHFMSEGYNDLIANNDVFKTKIDMHNKRFGTHYNSATEWSNINKDLKATGLKFEKQSARKPRK